MTAVRSHSCFVRGGWFIAAWLIFRSVATGVPPAAIDQADDRVDWETLYAWDLLERLQLSPSQGARLLPLFERACQVHLDRYHRLQSLHRQALQAYPPFLEQKKANVGVTPEIEAAAAAAHAGIKDLQIEYDEALKALETQAFQEILTPAQAELSRRYHADRMDVIRRAGGAVDRGKHSSDDRKQTNPYLIDPLTRQMKDLEKEREEMDEFSHPRGGPFGRFILAPPAGDLLYGALRRPQPRVVAEARRVWRVGTPSYPRALMEIEAEQVRDLKNQVNDWNLLNSLNLTADQAFRLSEIIAQAERSRVEQQTWRQSQRWLDDRLVRLERQVAGLLHAGQLKAMEEFSTCFKGKPNLRDPVRVGQADAQTNAEQWLEQIRSSSGAALTRAVEHRMDSEEKRLIGPMTPREKKERRDLLLSVAERAGDMSDLDFALSKGELAEQIAVKSRSLVIDQEVNRLQGLMNRPGKITRLMFNEPFGQAARVRALQLAGLEAVGSSRPLLNPKADDCEKRCGAGPGVAVGKE